MSAYAHFDGRCASLTADDTTGVKSIYPGASNAGSLSIVTGSDLPSVKVERDYAIALEARGGVGGYHWTMQSGELPSGLLFSASGFLYGKPTASGTFTVSLQVKDSSGFATQKNFSLIVQAPNPTPVIVGVEFKKKLTVFGNYFDSAAQVVVDGKVMTASLNGSALKTKKKAKLSTGVHVVYVVNEDGKRSNDFTLVVG
jgi:hypothetical protein